MYYSQQAMSVHASLEILVFEPPIDRCIRPFEYHALVVCQAFFVDDLAVFVDGVLVDDV